MRLKQAIAIIAISSALLLTPFLLTSNDDETKTMHNQDQTIELVYPKPAGADSNINHAIIWLHGLGASANDFPPIVPELGLQADRPVRFIFPQAPDRPITINGGMRMPGWYDIKGADIADKEDAVGMAESRAILESLINQQLQLGIPSTNIIVAGFSQGGAVAYHTFLRCPHKLAGLLALSTYLPFAKLLASEQSKINLATPIFASHGSFDPMVPIQLGKTSADKLTGLGYQVRWQSYPMQHQVVIEQIRDIGEWINQTFSSQQ